MHTHTTPSGSVVTPLGRTIVALHTHRVSTSFSSHLNGTLYTRRIKHVHLATPPRATADTVLQQSHTISEQQTQSSQYNWQQQWYPAAIIDDLDPTKPHPTTLLNKNLVLWYDGTTWNAFLDRCPHRLAALSEGRVEDNKLQCAYHGYEFASSGACVRVPNAADAKSHANALASPRACVEAFPTRQARGLLWVWGDSATPELAAATGLVLDDFAEEYVPVGPVWNTMEPFARTVPYDFETLLENVADPSHVPWSHHGVQGNRYKTQYGQFAMQPIEDPDKNPWGIFGVTLPGFTGKGQQTLTFQPPCRLQYTAQLPAKMGGGVFLFSIFCVPVSPGVSRLIATQRTDSTAFPLKLAKFKPKWMDHAFNRMEVLDGDSVFLHQLEHDLVQEANKNGATWKALYWLPTSADAMVTRVRQWLDDPQQGNGGPWGPNRYVSWGPRITDRRVLLDRYDSHTKHCKACSTAHARLGLLHTVSKWTSAVAAAATTMAALLWVRGGVPVGPVEVALLAALSLAAFAIARKAQQAQQALVFKDYIHSHR